jgi:hypothetical protein
MRALLQMEHDRHNKLGVKCARRVTCIVAMTRGKHVKNGSRET